MKCRTRAERKLGDVLKATPKNKGAKGVGPIAVPSRNRNDNATLTDIGIDKKLSSRPQKMAQIPEPQESIIVGSDQCPPARSSEEPRDDDALVDLGVVASELKVSRDHARSLCVAGRLPFVNVGTTDTRVIYRVRWSTLQDFKRREMRKTIDDQVRDVRETQQALRLAENGSW
jgi:hypothetical protein